MSLFFLSPVYLFGLVAASVPILIHLLNRRRSKRMPFPTVRFVLLSQRRIYRTYRLRHWIILALRTLAVASLVLLLAHPIFQTGAGLWAGANLRSVAVVFDNSLSMKWGEDGDGFEKAKDALRSLFSSFQPGDRVALLRTNTVKGREVHLQSEREVILREIDQLEISAGTADYSSALGRAYELLKEPAAERQIWLITDLGLTGWDRFSLASMDQYDPLIPLKIIRVDFPQGAFNATIREVRVRNREVAVGLPILLEASLINFGDREIRDLLVQLYLGEEKRDQKLVSIPAGGELAVSFQFQVDRPGEYAGSVVLQKEGLTGNEALYFTVEAPDKVRVLLVDGDPRTSLVQSETFFLSRALNPDGGTGTSPFLPTVIIPETLPSISPEAYDVLVLCNVPTIPERMVSRLVQYVRSGGGLLLFLGNRVDTEDYNRSLFGFPNPLLPVRLGVPVSLPEGSAEKIDKVDPGNPALSGFADDLLRQSLMSVAFRSYVKAEVASEMAMLSLRNGDPFLIGQKVGQGAVLVATSSADRDWNDLPLKTAYLPLVQSLIGYLKRESIGSFDTGILAGDTKSLQFPGSTLGESIRLTKPNGEERIVPLAPKGQMTSALVVENDQAGIYRISVSQGGAREITGPKSYAVNPPFLESRLEPVDGKELQRKLDPLRVEIIPLDSLKHAGKRMDLSLLLLIFLAVTLAAEGWLSHRVYE